MGCRPEAVLRVALQRLVGLLRDGAVNYFYALDQLKASEDRCPAAFHKIANRWCSLTSVCCRRANSGPAFCLLLRKRPPERGLVTRMRLPQR